ncbi:MAG: SDR family NAD(P)-dependent oxidoreductase [Clostridia bacterium]|nr:SDR family NAD(P)-dependent oxidoreductase [Clostridia bacterium]
MHYQKWYQKNTAPQVGRVAVVTGANSGIGFFAARGLAYLGAEVVLACRNEARAAAACERIRAELPTAQVSYMLVDLASFASIDAFASALAARYTKIDLFLHCAGVYYPRIAQTADGLPMTEGVNYVGTVRLAEAVLPLLDATGRMVFTTSLTDRFGKDRRAENEAEGYAAYARSKHLLSAYVVQKARKRGEDQPLFAATHPGITATDLLSPDKTSHKPLFSRLGHAFLYVFTHSPEKAALTALLALTGNVENGTCIGPRGLFGISGFPHKTRFCKQVFRRAARLLPKVE